MQPSLQPWATREKGPGCPASTPITTQVSLLWTLKYNLRNYVLLGMIGFPLEGGERANLLPTGHLAERISPTDSGL